MNTQQLLGWMNDPGSLGKEAGAQLETLTQSFPYFQTAHLLLIKSLHNQNSFLYNNQLKVSAAYATNRKVLYELITKKAEVASLKSEVGSLESVVDHPELPNSDLQHQTSDAPLQPESKPVPPIAPIAPEFPKKRFVSNPDEWESGMLRQLQLLHHWKANPGTEINIPAEKTGYTKQEQKTEEPKEELKPEEKPTAADEINTLLYVLVEPDGAEDLSETEIPVEEEAEPAATSTEPAAEWEVKVLEPEEKETEIPVAEIDVPEDPVQQEIIREAISSSIELEVDDTLPSPEELIPSGQKNAVPAPEKQDLTPAAEEIPEEKEPEESPEPTGELSFAAWLKQVDRKPEPEPKKAVAEKDNNLIDKFIQESPRIKASKNTFYSPVNMAKKSVQESDEFITETLARIYVKQGNIPKAIRAYQKLSLKFPEKTIYFAALIEELKRTPK